MAIVLENNVLSVTVEEPGLVYKGARFDHTGNITRIVWENKFSFCSQETTRDFDPSKHGQGLYNEFGINRPVGYDDCPVGERFPKPGVGLLTRHSPYPYNFFRAYEVEPFDVLTEHNENAATFTVLPLTCRGYSMKLVKKISISGPSLVLDYVLENTGSRQIFTNEYVHNFIAVNHSEIGPAYSLTVPGNIPAPGLMVEAVNPENTVLLNSNSLEFRSGPAKDFFFSPFTTFQSHGEWTISHKTLHAAMKEETDFIPEMMNVWGTKHVISPELFVTINLAPGQTKRWRRVFSFIHV